MTENIGLIGLGLVGSALADRFLAAGFGVVGFDTDPTRLKEFANVNGQPVSNAAKVVERCRRIVLSLPDSHIAAQVLAGLGVCVKSGDIVVDTTTGHPGDAALAASSLASKGVLYLDAAIAGSSRQVRSGETIVIAGGEAAAFAACHDLFRCFARQAFHAGPAGHGMRMKLVTNLALGLERAVLAETLGFARALGLPLESVLPILKAGPAYSRVMDTKGRKMTTGDFTPEGRLSQHLKDVRLILELAERNRSPVPFSQLHREILERLDQEGFGGADNSAIMIAFEPE